MSDLMARLDAIEARAEKATKGPWREVYAYKKDTPGTLVAATAPGHQVHTDYNGGTRPSMDLEFIAAARTDLPALVRALRLAVEALERVGHWSEKGSAERALAQIDRELGKGDGTP